MILIEITAKYAIIKVADFCSILPLGHNGIPSYTTKTRRASNLQGGRNTVILFLIKKNMASLLM
jgi:hypothetical protein